MRTVRVYEREGTTARLLKLALGILSLRGSLPIEFLPPILAQAQAEDLIRWEEDWPVCTKHLCLVAAGAYSPSLWSRKLQSLRDVRTWLSDPETCADARFSAVWKNVLRKRFPKEWQQLEAEDKNPESWRECFTVRNLDRCL